MRFKYSPEVDILMAYIGEETFAYGEDNEGVIVHHSVDGKPLLLEILNAKQFVMFANASLVTGQEITNPDVPDVPYTKERDVSIRLIPNGDADLRFKYRPDTDTLTVKFGEGASDFCRQNHEVAVNYDHNELPTGLKIAKARQFVLGAIQSVLLQEEVSVA
jgi:uncharacterized protein YuzE